MMAFNCKSNVLRADSLANNISTEFTLYVDNVPEELNERGFLQIFEHYGEVIRQFYRPNATWGYITYGTSYEAQNAIKDLNNVPPLYLKVSFSRERGSVKIDHVKPLSENDEGHSVNSVKQESRSMDKPFIQTRHGQPMDVFKKRKQNMELSSSNYTTDNDLLYNCPTDPYTHNPYEDTGPYTNSNLMWTRGQMIISKNGKKHVSLGRGYTMYEIPEPDSEIPNYISNVYEKRNLGLYEYGNDMLEHLVGKCERCHNVTKFTCQKCHTFYCSKSCQVIDWPQHRLDCKSIPALVTSINSVNLSQNQNGEQTQARNISSIQVPLRRPKTSSTPMSQNNIVEDIINTTVDYKKYNINSSKKSKVDKSTDQSNVSSMNKTNQITRTSEQSTVKSNRKSTKKMFKNSQDSLTSSDDTTLQKFNGDVTKKEEDITFSRDLFLSTSKFIDVQVIVKNGHEYWVQKKEDDENIAKFMIDLQSAAEKAQKAKPVVGNLYAVQYETIWHRALVKSLDPLTVHFVDYGNDEYMNDIINDFRIIPYFKDYPYYAAKIRLSKKAFQKHRDINFGDVISVKMISVDANEVINVEVEGEESLKSNTSLHPVVNDTSRNITTTPKKPQSIVNTISCDDIGSISIRTKLSDHVYNAILIPEQMRAQCDKLFKELSNVCNQATKDSDYSPQIGDLICGKMVNENREWVRGYVVSLETPLKMATVDDTNVVEISECMPCPDDFVDICTLGINCKIKIAVKFIDAESSFKYQMNKRISNNKVEIKIEIPNMDFVMADVTPWSPMYIQTPLQYVTLKNKSKVHLTAYKSHVVMFARPDTDVEHYQHVMQSVAKCAQSALPLCKPPLVGEMVIAHYVDDNYYRAIVTNVKNDKIEISYVDFGNAEVTNIKKLKIMNDELKQLRSCTSKIVLKDIPQDTPMTKEINEYLAELVGTEAPLTCTFEGIPMEDGVYLQTLGGENVNKTISEMLVPTWNKTEKEDTKYYMKPDLNVKSIGTTGDIIEAIVLHPIQDGHIYSMCEVNFELMSHIFEVMPKMMSEYCEKCEHYVPRQNELCLASYENAWYRAICYSRAKTADSSYVFFVDYGNFEEVAHKDIRRMPKDFITPNAIANICNIVNLAPTDEKGEYSPEVVKRIPELMTTNSIIKIKVIEYNDDEECYNVEIPRVRDKLIEEGLIMQ